MSLNGQLSDLHLSELIEFFCNQRKTGRLKVDYALAPGVFFIKEGELVDARVGALNGTDAVHFALTLPSAAFDFSAGVQSSRRTINDSWASVVIEGLRRIDEGVAPAQFDAYPSEGEIDEATREYLNCVEEAKRSRESAQVAGDAKAAGTSAAAESDREATAPLSLTVDASHGGGRSKFMIASVAAAILVVCAVAAVPVSRRFMRKDAPAAAAQSAPAAAESPAQQPDGAAPAANAEAQPSADASAEEAAAAARREAREREARERARKLREEAAKNAAEDQTLAPAPKPAPAASGPKTVRVSINYDEAGRVTQATAVGTSPGAEAYAATAVRIARGRRFTPGKAGATVVTIPIN